MDGAELDQLFEKAVAAIGAGDLSGLNQLLSAHPDLASQRLTSPGPWLRDKIGRALDGFFKDPYLLWFVAEDLPVIGGLPKNIANIATTIIRAAECSPHLQDQLDSTLRLVAWSGISQQCGVQIPLLDALIDAGASPDGVPNNALVNGHEEAAAHAIARGASPTLASAACIGLWDQLQQLAANADEGQKQFALVLAALNGKAEGVRRLLSFGADVNRPSSELYSHGTPLHHAVCSGSFETVRTLVEAGADANKRDTAWNGTPLGWAEHYLDEKKDGVSQKRYGEIVEYLRQFGVEDKHARLPEAPSSPL
jgi:peptide-methionine (S)-S-oxide reductase